MIIKMGTCRDRRYSGLVENLVLPENKEMTIVFMTYIKIDSDENKKNIKKSDRWSRYFSSTSVYNDSDFLKYKKKMLNME